MRKGVTALIMLMVAMLYVVYADDQRFVVQTKESEPSTYVADVSRVIDGDTVLVRIATSSLSADVKKQQSVRLIGVDAPEIHWPTSTNSSLQAECYGLAAREYVADKLKNRTVRVTLDPTQPSHDRYDRLLGYVYTDSRQSINEQLLEGGYARELTVGVAYDQQELLRAAELEARENEVGLWSVCA